MGAMYGHAWTANYGTDPHGDTGRVWARRLAGIEGRQLAHGFELCEAKAKQDVQAGRPVHPPSLPEFAAWCRSPGAEPSFRALPRPERSPEEWREKLNEIPAVAQLRALFGGRS